MSDCLFVCLSARIFQNHQKPHVRLSPGFQHTLPMPVNWSSFDNSEIRYVLPVLCITSCFNVMRVIYQIIVIKIKHDVMFHKFRQVAAPDAKSDISDCLVMVMASKFPMAKPLLELTAVDSQIKPTDFRCHVRIKHRHLLLLLSPTESIDLVD